MWSLLLHACGIGVSDTAHPNALPAPQADLMVAGRARRVRRLSAQGWVICGGVIALATIALDGLLGRRGSGFRLPVLAVALGLYLPLSLSMAIAFGGFVAWLGGRGAAREGRGLLAAAGTITGEALMRIFIALPAAWPGLVLILDSGRWSGRVARSTDAGPRAWFS